MKILDRYLAKHIIATILLATFVLLCVDLFFSVVKEIKYVGRLNYDLSVALGFLALTIPSKIYMVFPWAALLGTLLALGALAAKSELIVMRASAVSIGRISWAVLKAAILLMLIALFLGEGLAPITERFAINLRISALSGGQTLQTLYGIWARQGNVFLHVDSVDKDKTLRRVTRYQFNDKGELMEASVASSATQELNGHWVLRDVIGTKIAPNRTERISHATLSVDTLLDLDVLETTGIKHLERLSLWQLWRAIKYRQANELTTIEYKVALWEKIFQPVNILVMVFLAIPFIFGPLRSSSVGGKILTGVMVGFGFYFINAIFVPLTEVAAFPPVVATMLPSVVFLGIGLGMMRRVR